MAVYHANVEIGTAHVALVGKGNYFGVKTATFQIVAGSIADAEVTGVAARYFYTGEAVAVEPAVSYGGAAIAEGVDYTLAFAKADGTPVSEVVDKGDYTVTVSGTGRYTGSLSRPFSVAPYFSVYRQEGDAGERELVKEYTEAEFKALMPSGGQPAAVSAVYRDEGGWKVLSSNEYVTVARLLVDADRLSEKFREGARLEVGDGSSARALSYEDYNARRSCSNTCTFPVLFRTFSFP